MSLKSHSIAFRAAILSGSDRPLIAFGAKWAPRTSRTAKGERRLALSNSGYVAVECRRDHSWTTLRDSTLWIMKNDQIIGRINKDGMFPRNGHRRHPDYQALVAAYKAYRQATLPPAAVKPVQVVTFA